jgi:gamma-glutamylcyclotransferase (GGCT)/AIG2-like uncharacterized protein YtfP
VPAPGSDVWGVLYEVEESDLEAMDRGENVPAAYRRQDVTVVDEQGKERRAITYVANGTGDFEPHPDYLRTIIRGAEDRGLPDEYIHSLKGIRTH